MQLHWKQTHGLTASATEIDKWTTKATLQTVFRGNKLKCFEVEQEDSAASNASELNNNGDNTSLDELDQARYRDDETLPINFMERPIDHLDKSED
jgi:hypothetical protein